MKRYLVFGWCVMLAGCQEPGSGAASPPVAPVPVTSAAPVAASATAPAPAPEVAEPAPTAKKLTAPATPDAIKAPPGAQPILKAHAKGAQIYACQPKKEAPKQFEWSLKAPEAVLFDEQGKPIGKHFAGPTWEASDGSKVIGALKAKVDAPTALAIPWLLLETKSNEGQGAFAKVTFVQRVDTEGGKAPATGCDTAHAKAETRVDYEANYYFYAP